MADPLYSDELGGHLQLDPPGLLRGFSARAGLQGPQIVLTWDSPAHPDSAVMVRRKTGEHPRDVDDGELVLLEVDDPSSISSAVDLVGLLPEDAEPGVGRWWYYRAFVRPAPLPLDEQLGGRAEATVVGGLSDPMVWDVQGARAATLWASFVGAHGTATVSTGPSEDGPWVALHTLEGDAGESASYQVPPGANYVQVAPEVGATVVLRNIMTIGPEWVTSEVMTATVYVYKSGRHLAAAMSNGLPGVYLDLDTSNAAPVFEAEGQDGEVFNLGETGTARGHLWKMLCIYLAEFDRVDAYLRAVRLYAADIDEMPPQAFAHVAQVLGYSLDPSGRDYDDVRAEISRLAGVWKHVGTTRLVVATSRQILGIVPRVQEGAGRVFRVADPTLYNRPPDILIGEFGV